MTRLSTVLVFLAVFFCGCSNEPEHWQEAQKENSDESYDVYLQTFPKGPHATEARQRREQLMEQQDWATAVEDNQIESIGNYIQNHPKGAHLIQARELLRSVRDEVAWKSALQSDSVPGYQKYISGGWLIHAATARDSLMNLVEKRDWMTASEDGTIDAYRAYLANHRDGPNSQAALVLNQASYGSGPALAHLTMVTSAFLRPRVGFVALNS